MTLHLDNAPGRARDRAVVWAWPFALAAAAFILYSNALGNPFLSDDRVLIATNPTVAHPSAAAATGLWTAGYWEAIREDGRRYWINEEGRYVYRPVAIASFWLGARLGANEPWQCRVVNVLLHAIAAWLVGLWCTRWRGRRAGALAAAIVLLHPIATDVVNRLVGRADILVLVGVAGFLAVQRAAELAGWTWRRTALAVTLAAIALGSKESGAVVVPLAIVQAWLCRPDRFARPGGAATRAAATPPRTGTPASRHAWRGVLAVLLPTAAYLVGRSFALDPSGYRQLSEGQWDLTANPLAGHGLVDRLPSVAAVALFYLKLFVWPWPLLAFEQPARLPAWADPGVWLGFVALGVLAVTTVRLLWRRHGLALAGAWWLLSFLVVGQLLFPIGAYSEVRLAYPMLGGFALAVGWLSDAMARRWRPLAIPALATVVLAGFVAVWVIRERNVEMRSDLSLAETDVRRRPESASAWLRLGELHLAEGRVGEAERAMTKATELAPQAAEAWFDLAALYEGRGRRDRARPLYERALTARPDHRMALIKLSAIVLDDGDLSSAERLLERAAAVAPDDPFVDYNLAVLDQQRGRTAQAIARLERLLTRHPEFGRARKGLAALRAAGTAAR